MSDPLPEIRSTSVSRRDSNQRIRIRFRVCNISRVRLEFTRYVTRGKIPTFDSIRNGPLIYIYNAARLKVREEERKDLGVNAKYIRKI